MAYKDVTMGSAWDFEENKSFEGMFLGKEENVGPNNSMMYEFKDLEGKPVSIWGSTVLDTKMKHVETGTRVKIVYLGKVKSPKGNTYKDFAVALWEE